MAFLQASKLSLSFGDRTILNQVELSLSTQTKAALSGSNGSGKSTLLKVIAGVTPYDSGEIHKSAQLRLGYLPQSTIIDKNLSLYQELQKAYTDILTLIDRRQQLEIAIASFSQNNNQKESNQLEELLNHRYEIEEQINQSDYYNRDKEIDLVLKGLGIDTTKLHHNCSTFSGGQQMRIALAKILLSKPDILLLDEPTNYLDIEARQWLATFLLNYSGGYLLVSHDRYFLDKTTKETIEIFQGNLKRYKGSYCEYEKTREVELNSLVKAYQKQQEEIERAQIFIRRFKATASKAALVQSRIKSLEKMELIQIPDALKKIHFTFPPPPHSGEIVYTVNQLSKNYGDKTIFSQLDITIKKGEKIAISGVNGAGKTTLLKILAKRDNDFSGMIKLGTGVNLGYFAQDSSDFLEPTNTVIEEIESCCPTSLYGKIRSLLGAFLFSDDDIYKKISVLSGGEKNRLSLLKLLLHPHNLLILDEPTNHLDIHSKDVLLDALQNFEGTVLFVSHDRHFTQGLAKRVLHLENGKLFDYQGDYEYFCWKQENKNEDEKTSPQNKQKSPIATATLNNQRSFEAQKEQRNKIKNLQKKEELILQEISELETNQTKLQDQLNQEDIYTDHKKSAEITNQLSLIQTKLNERTKEWEKILTDIENISKE